MRLKLIAMALVLVVSSPSWAFSDFVVCDTCYTTSQFAQTAEQRSLSMHPGMTGIDPVYVANPSTSVVRFFNVHRSFNSDFDPLGGDDQIADLLAGSIAPARGPLSLNGGFFVAHAVEAVGDPTIIDTIGTASIALNALILEISLSSVINAKDVPGLEELESAIELIGGNNLKRTLVRNALNDHLNGLQQTALLGLGNLVVGAFNKFLSESQLTEGFSVILKFQDGTQITIEVSAREVMAYFESDWQLEIREDSVRWSDRPDPVPSEPGDFSGYEYNGPYLSGWHLKQLALRWGIPIGNQPGLSCDWSCSGDHCRLTCSSIAGY